MSSIYKLKNISGTDGTWEGQFIANDITHVVDKSDLETFRSSEEIMKAVADGSLQVEGSDKVFTNVIEGWDYFNGDVFTKSSIDGKSLLVHSSYKPSISDTSIYAAWVGSGDDVDNDIIGAGELLEFDMEPGLSTVSKVIKFTPSAGRVWIHEGYLKFTNGGKGDNLTADVVAPATLLQQSVNLDLILDGDQVKLSPSGPGTGTHGFAATPVLIPRTFSKDGGWDYDGVNLTPNMSNTGMFMIRNVKIAIHRYINRIPCIGTASSYVSLSSNETTELILPYYIEITCNNVSDTTWTTSVLLEIYREKTI